MATVPTRTPESTDTGTFTPYVAASLSPAEFTVRAIILGALFGLLFGASTVYLGLRAGLTVSASIPIAVLAISVLKKLGGSTILENNIVQTIGSAGESVAGGVVFTIPALIFLVPYGPDYFNYLQITLLTLAGGILLAGVVMIAATLKGLAGIATAYVMYVRSPRLPQQLAGRWRRLYALSLNKWYVDELYDRLFVRPTVRLARSLWREVDMAVIDGAVNGIAAGLGRWGLAVRQLQDGQLQHYALGMAFGLFVLVSMYLFW